MISVSVNMTEPIITIVDEDHLRKLFSEGEFVSRAESGELAIEIVKNKHPSQTAANEPFCTKSQMISYRRPDGTEVARAHRYLRPDGSTGASGLPDPKKVLYKGILFQLGSLRIPSIQ